jgi:probable rRNA maturation factor
LKYGVAPGLVRRLGDAMLRELELPAAELSVLLTDDPSIQVLNRDHRHKDRPTDVLAFPMSEGAADRPQILGDVVISLDTAERQAVSRRRPLIEEVRFLLAHGLLHLVGYDHGNPAEKKRMASVTRRLVRAAPLPVVQKGRPSRRRKLPKRSRK